jgi:hypothetical protein
VRLAELLAGSLGCGDDLLDVTADQPLGLPMPIF